MSSLDVAIVGGGASGTLVAIHWLKQLMAPGKAVIFDEHHRFARGVAYSSVHPHHWLNVPVGKMSAFPDQPDHFLEWLRQRDSTVQASSFVPRSRFGHYLEDVFRHAREQAPQGTRVQTVAARVIRVERYRQGYRLHLEAGAPLVARQVVLATGHLTPLDPPGWEGWADHPRYHRYPWSPEWVRQVRPEDSVLLLGAGLTMVDAVMSLRHAGHRGKIWAVSRHGLLPRVHGASSRGTLRAVDAPGESLRSVLRRVRALVQSNAEGWRTVVDSLRPVTAQLWTGFSLSEKRRFLRHLRAYWDVHRHRTPPAVAAVLERLERTGQLEILAARIQSVQQVSEDLRVQLRLRGEAALMPLSVQHIVNCTGPASDIRKHGGPLIDSLVSQGLAHVDDLGMGLEVDSPSLFAVGPLRRGVLWESTAIPEIRMQAAQLAETLVTSVNRQKRPLRWRFESSRRQVGRGLAVAVPVLAAAAYFFVPWYRALPDRFRWV